MPRAPATRSDEADPLRLLQQGWEAVRRYRARAIAFFVGTLALVVVATLLLPKTYESQAKLLVKIGRESVTLDPTATIGQTLSVYDSRETEISSVLEILGSRTVLESVVDALGPAAILDEPGATASPDEEAAEPPAVAAAPVVTDREKAVEALMQTTGVAREKKSNVLSVTAKAHSPALAQQVVAAILDAFRERYLAVHSAEGSYEFFQEQETLLGRQLEAATRSLGRARNELDMGTVEGQRKAIEGRLSSLAELRSAAEAELVAARARINVLRTSIAALPANFVSQEVTGFAEDAAGRTRTRLHELRLREERLLSALTPENPQVLAVRDEIAAAERLLARGARETQTTTAANPARQQLELARLQEESNAASLAARVDSLERQHDRALASLRRLNEQEGHVTQLVQRVDLLRAEHRNYAEKLEQTRVARELARERISNVTVWQQPTYVAKATGPKRRLIAACGFVVAVIGAIGLALGSDLLDRRRHAADSESNDEPTRQPPSRTTPLRSRLAATMTH